MSTGGTDAHACFALAERKQESDATACRCRSIPAAWPCPENTRDTPGRGQERKRRASRLAPAHRLARSRFPARSYFRSVVRPLAERTPLKQTMTSRRAGARRRRPRCRGGEPLRDDAAGAHIGSSAEFRFAHRCTTRDAWCRAPTPLSPSDVRRCAPRTCGWLDHPGSVGASGASPTSLTANASQIHARRDQNLTSVESRRRSSSL